jgi:hypothetical protein
LFLRDIIDTTALDHATTPKWRSIPHSTEIQFALNNVAFHIEALAEESNLMTKDNTL